MLSKEGKVILFSNRITETEKYVLIFLSFAAGLCPFPIKNLCLKYPAASWNAFHPMSRKNTWLWSNPETWSGKNTACKNPNSWLIITFVTLWGFHNASNFLAGPQSPPFYSRLFRRLSPLVSVLRRTMTMQSLPHIDATHGLIWLVHPSYKSYPNWPVSERSLF